MIDNKRYVSDMLINDMVKLARVDTKSGRFVFIKMLNDEAKYDCYNVEYIDDYFRKVLAAGFIYKDDIENFEMMTSLAYIQKKLLGKKKRLSYTFRNKSGHAFSWMTFEVVVPWNYSDENPEVIYCWKYADSDSAAMGDSLLMLSRIYYKMIKVNLTDDSYEILKSDDRDEAGLQDVSSEKFSDWVRKFADSGYVYYQDIEEFKAYMNMYNISARFRSGTEYLRFRYRRKVGNDYKWVSMEIMPSVEYTNDNQSVVVYVKDINDDYVAEVSYQRNLEFYCNNDILTGIWNRYHYDSMCSQYCNDKNYMNIGCLFADLNGLKFANDNYGHEQGDALIKRFADMLTNFFGSEACMRISGDEFVVVMGNSSREDTISVFESFYSSIQAMEQPIASVGYAWEENAMDIQKVMKQAEEKMYEDKAKFYVRFPWLKR